jgi:hypothetical protein
MMEVKINAMLLHVPEGFHVLSKEERAKLNMLKDGEGEVISDPERHIIISAAWKKHNVLLGMLADEDGVIHSMEKQVAGPMKGFGYELEGFTSETVGSKEAKAFIYHYNVQDTDMSAESMILKHDNVHYYIHCYYRTELKEESRAVLQEIFGQTSWE